MHLLIDNRPEPHNNLDHLAAFNLDGFVEKEVLPLLLTPPSPAAAAAGAADAALLARVARVDRIVLCLFVFPQVIGSGPFFVLFGAAWGGGSVHMSWKYWGIWVLHTGFDGEGGRVNGAGAGGAATGATATTGASAATGACAGDAAAVSSSGDAAATGEGGRVRGVRTIRGAAAQGEASASSQAAAAGTCAVPASGVCSKASRAASAAGQSSSLIAAAAAAHEPFSNSRNGTDQRNTA